MKRFVITLLAALLALAAPLYAADKDTKAAGKSPQQLPRPRARSTSITPRPMN